MARNLISLQARRRRGSILLLTLVLLVMLLTMVAFGVDTGRMVLERTRVQQAVDAASLAAADVLYVGGDQIEMDTAVNYYLTANGIDVAALASDELTVEPGQWDDTLRTFAPTTFESATACRVHVELNELGSVFAPVFGKDKFSVQAQATSTARFWSPQDIIVVIDCSGSMAAAERMPQTRDAALALSEQLTSEDRLGLVVFSWPDASYNKTGFLEKPLSFDHAPVKERIPDLSPAMYALETNPAGGLRVAIEEHLTNPRDADDAQVSKAIVILSDGDANEAEPPESDPNAAITYYANQAAAAGIVVHAITLGQDVDQAVFQGATDLTGGTFQHVEDDSPTDLSFVFRRIGRGLGPARIVD